MSAHGRSHWIKLYVEMNHDSKIGLLTDDLKWRYVSVLLLAGELGENGFLPEINDMAWQLHAAPETVSGQMRTLAQRGLVELRQYIDGSERWFVSKFAERQSSSTNAERQRQWRARQNNEGVTKRYAEVTPEYRIQNTETEEEGESGAIAPAPAHPAPPPASSPSFQPVPETVKRQKARRGIKAPEPEASAAPPALKMLHELTAYWPGDDNAPLILAGLGDDPDRSALARAVELWRGSGHKINNWLGICDWYHEIVRDPGWTPQARFRRGGNSAAANPMQSVSKPAPGSQPVTW